MTDCPRTSGLIILSRKWSYFVLRSLTQPRGFTEILRELKFATNHVLSGELKRLQQESLLTLTGTKYSLTPAGQALLVAVEPLHQWGCTHGGLKPCPADTQCSNCAQYVVLMKPKKERDILKDTTGL